jgi:hypothetical protein
MHVSGAPVAAAPLLLPLDEPLLPLDERPPLEFEPNVGPSSANAASLPPPSAASRPPPGADEFDPPWDPQAPALAMATSTVVISKAGETLPAAFMVKDLPVFNAGLRNHGASMRANRT